jgi:predicted nucleotide-binding protein
MTLTTKAIAALVRPFQGGEGPSHSTIELIFAGAGADQYLPEEGNKVDRVMGGLRALKAGRTAAVGRAALEPDPRKLQLVASELAARHIVQGLVDPADIPDALDDPEPTQSEPSVMVRSMTGSSVNVTDSHQEDRDDIDGAVDSANVMVVHGQDKAAARALFDWLRSVGLKPQEWTQLVSASGNGSPFIGDVLKTAFRQAQAVVVLFTPDEHVQLRNGLSRDGASWRLQARPNVLFEAGMAFASHPRRTVLVVLGSQEVPSDLGGRHYVRLDSPGQLRDLAKRLETAGCPVSLAGDDWLDLDRFPMRDGISAFPDDAA